MAALQLNLRGLSKHRAMLLRRRSYHHPCADTLNALVGAPAAPARPTPGELSGWTIGLKSNIASTLLRTTCGSQALQTYTSPGDSTAWRLLQQAGAVLAGATNMDEFGMGSHTRDSMHGRTANPWDAERSAGGSSGGGAAAVARGLCRVAVGSDTGGSVRLPAAWCGVVGFKPSYGRVSRAGLVAYGSSLDTVGLLARTTADVRQAFAVLAHPDARDMTCMTAHTRHRISHLCHTTRQDRPNPTGALPLAHVRVGVPAECWVHELSDACTAAWRQACHVLQALGCSVERVSLGHLQSALPAYYTVALAEAASNMARFDGVRYGEPSGMGVRAGRAALLGAEVQRRVLLGTYVMGVEARRRFLGPAQRIRRLVQRDMDGVFALPNAMRPGGGPGGRGVDVLLMPTAVGAAPLVSEETAEEGRCRAAGYVTDVMTVPANLAGIPAVSVPFGSDRGLPLGMQLMAQYGDDHLLLDVAEHLEAAWAARAPRLNTT
ncbi:Trimeric GatFAB AmidoTransferase(AdT) complex subunit [Coemansia interrupta]|uniref:Glutamyl-tRNA(Gln) amidotransferase subunit A, mitochondrial n=1 Tax=Coemansia interrupta TaxID=1126814 RepID=A0A9W8LLL1_9FUNG|nr:Trimeric GatFAB AmidoTransferase(AdT) complex subunit [Coemansia interrupta]